MIDIHCHILPQFDDGSGSLEESVEMARQAAESGVRAIVATPHFPGERRSLGRLPLLLERYEALSQAIDEAGIGLQLCLGSEILCQPQTPELARRGELPTLGNTAYLLTEFPFGVSYGYMDDMLRSLSDCGYLPVVAHPERYDAIQREPRLLEAWFRRGYVLQLNKGSILGSLGDDARQTALWALDRGLAHVIASDAHGISHRNADMTLLCRWLEDNYREDFVQLLLEENPHRLLQGEPMAPVGIL